MATILSKLLSLSKIAPDPKLSVDQRLKQAETRVAELKGELDARTQAIRALHAERAKSLDVARRLEIQKEIDRLEAEGGALQVALGEAQSELERARKEHGRAAAVAAGEVAIAAERELKIRADAHARALSALLKTQDDLKCAAETRDRAREHAVSAAAAAGIPAPKLHRARGAALASALVRDALWAIGVRGGTINLEWASPRRTLADVVVGVRHDLRMQVVGELQAKMSEAEILRALLDDTYQDLRDGAHQARAEQHERAARASEEREEQRKAEQKAAREAARAAGISFPRGGAIL